MNETQNRDRDLRLQKLLERQGEDLVRGLIEEFSLMNREIAALKRELAALSDYQAARDRMLVIDTAATKAIYLPRIVSIEADQNLRFQDGFYPLEHTSDGTPFRWTGPAPQFSFDLFIDRSGPVELKLEAISCIDFDIQGNVTLLADGESVSARVEHEDFRIDVTAILPPRRGDSGTNLVFALPAALVPPESDDTRSLGLAFRRLHAATRNAAEAAVPSPKARKRVKARAGKIDDIGLGDSAAAE